MSKRKKNKKKGKSDLRPEVVSALLDELRGGTTREKLKERIAHATPEEIHSAVSRFGQERSRQPIASAPPDRKADVKTEPPKTPAIAAKKSAAKSSGSSSGPKAKPKSQIITPPERKIVPPPKPVVHTASPGRSGAQTFDNDWVVTD